MVNLGLSRVDDAVAAKHPVGCVQVSCGWERTHPPAPPWLPSRGRQVTLPAGAGGLARWAPACPGYRLMGTSALCRHRHGLRLADVHSEEVSIPFAVEPSSGCGCRLCGQLRGDKSGVREMQQPLALPGDRAAPQRHEHRSAKLGELQPGHGGLGAGGVWNTAFMPPDPRLTLPTP
nr:transmembrane protein 141 isoform X1 [Pongo pygmaeus]